MATKLKEVDVVIVGSRLDRRHPGQGTGRSRAEGGRARARRACARPSKDYAVPNIRDELRYVMRHDLMQNTARDTLTVRNNPTQEALPMRRLGSFLPGEVRRRLGRALERPHLALDRHGVQDSLASTRSATAGISSPPT